MRAIHDFHAILQSFRSKDVSLLAVCIADQCDVCGSVGIVFDSDYSCRNIIFISLEIDNSVFSSVSAAAMSDGDFTLIVTAGILLQRYTKADVYKRQPLTMMMF